MYKYTARYAKGHLRIWIQNTEYSFCEKGYTNEKNTNLIYYYIYNIYIIYIVKFLSNPLPIAHIETVFCILYPSYLPFFRACFFACFLRVYSLHTSQKLFTFAVLKLMRGTAHGRAQNCFQA